MLSDVAAVPGDVTKIPVADLAKLGAIGQDPRWVSCPLRKWGAGVYMIWIVPHLLISSI